MKGAAAEEGDAAVTTPPPPPTCPVCMESWTCSGDHRICCIPCGHVYGRSCLERWLHHSAHDYAKCPQCGEQFEDKLITNLYAPGNLWDGCCRLQELKDHYRSVTKEMEGDMLLRFDRLRAEIKEEIAKSHAELKESFRADWEQALDEINRSWSETVATANTNMTLIKDEINQMAEEEDATATDLLDQMKKMAEEEDATATDLIEFMERSLHPTGHQTNQNGYISMGTSKRRSFFPICSRDIVWIFIIFSLVAFQFCSCFQYKGV